MPLIRAFYESRPQACVAKKSANASSALTVVARYITTVTGVEPDSSSTTVGMKVASIDVDPGETITCTFTNSGDDNGDSFAQPIDSTMNSIFTDQRTVFSNGFTAQYLVGVGRRRAPYTFR